MTIFRRPLSFSHFNETDFSSASREITNIANDCAEWKTKVRTLLGERLLFVACGLSGIREMEANIWTYK